MTTKKQVQANRTNALKSTGPRTDKGKTTSSQSALKHGLWATKPTAVPRGLFKEDQEDLDLMTARVMKALGPRDAAEAHQAMRIAMLYVRLGRLGKVEAEAFAGDTHNRADGWAHPGEVKREKGARQALEESLNKATILDGRIGRSLREAYAVYEGLQKRPLKDNED